MKRPFFLLALALPLLIGAALWLANWSVKHPSASASWEFGALIAGADSVAVTKLSGKKTNLKVLVMVNPALRDELLNRLRFDVATSAWNSTPPARWKIDYRRGGRALVSFQLAQGRTVSVLSGGPKRRSFRLNARADASLRQKLKLAGAITFVD